MTATERIARQTLDIMPKPEPSDDKPESIILTISLVIMIVKLCMLAWECWKNGDKAVTIARNPGFTQRWYLRRIVKKVLVPAGHGDKVDKIMAALLQIARAATAEDIEAIFKEAQEDKEIWVAGRSLGIL